MDLEAVAQPTASDKVAALIRSRVQSGELPVGARLPSQRALAASMSVARQVVQQALSVLEAEGFVETRRGASGGSFVTEPPTHGFQASVAFRRFADEFDEIIDFRIGVERQIAVLAAKRRSAQDLAEMLDAIQSLPTGEPSRAVFREADGRFHAALARASGNARLEAALRQARADLFMPTDAVPYREAVDVTRREHQAIYRAVERQDPAAAARALTNHVEGTRVHVHALMNALGSE